MHMFNENQFNQVLKIHRIVLHLTGTYNDQHIRPYETSMTQNTVDMFMERTNAGNDLSTPALAGITNDILRPSAISRGVAGIVNGWGQQRLAFFLEADVHGVGAPTRQVITGYTDHPGVHHNAGHVTFDPNMRLYFNSTMTITQRTVTGPDGQFNRVSTRDAAHFLTAPLADVQNRTATAVTVRPEDVYSTLETAPEMAYGLPGSGDRRVNFSVSAKKSRRSNNVTSAYMSKTLGAYKEASDAGLSQETGVYAPFEEEYGATDSNVVGSARRVVEEQLVSHDPFVKTFAGDPTVLTTMSATWGELKQMNPHLEDIAHVHLPNPNKPTRYHMAGQTSDWRASTREANIATMLAHAVPAIMLDCMLVTAKVSITNQTIYRSFEVIPGEPTNSFTQNIDRAPLMQQFMARLKMELVPNLPVNADESVYIDVECNVNGETKIQVGIDMPPQDMFVVPSFADALITPMVAPDQQNIQNIATDLGNLCNTMTHAGAQGRI